MKGKKYSLGFSFLLIGTLFYGLAENTEAPKTIDDISIQHGTYNTKIRLESKTPLSIVTSHYLKELPYTILLDIENAQFPQKSKIEPANSLIIKSIRTEERQDGRLSVFIEVKERVPYHIFNSPGATIVELNTIYRSKEEIKPDPALLKEIENQRPPLASLRDIQVLQRSDRVNISALLSGYAVPHVFVLEKPLRLVIDLYNALFKEKIFSRPIDTFSVERVRASQFQSSPPYDISRIVFDLKEPKFYSLDTENGKITVTFPRDLASQFPVVVDSTPVSNPIQENRQDKNEPKPLGTLTQNPPEEIEIPVTPVSTTGSPGSLSTQDTNTRAISPQETEFLPKTINQTQQKYSGDIITLKFKDADLQAVIFYLAEFAGLNVTFDPGVSGIVSVNLVDVPWDQALELILKQNRMGKTIEGNILRIAPINILTQEQEEQRRLRESQELAGPLVTKIFPLSYSKAGEVHQLLQTRLSDRAEIIVDSRTNKLVITEVSDRLPLLEQLIGEFDTATPQVSIEARIVEANSTFIRNLGIQWGWRGISDPFYGNQTSLKFPNKILVDGAMIPQGIVTKGVGGPLGGYAINLPAPAFSTVTGLSFSNVLDTFRLDMAITALETSGSGRIISAPKVTTQNNQEAEIIQGAQIPIQTVANFTVTTRYQNAALELRATPQITAEGTIIMNIEINNNAPDFSNLVNGIPPLLTQSAQTTVMVPDGGTTVIGGIYRTEDSITRERVPFFHKIPILGNLFKSFARTKKNRELLIFITPRIIK